MNKLDPILNKLEEICKPTSIFLYGSRARTDFLDRSDFEIGVLIPKKRYIGRSEIKKHINEENVNIYPFEYEGFIKGKIDTPFQNTIYLRELVLAGKTLRGKNVLENMVPPKIKTIDIIQDLRFNIGYALASAISHRNGDSISSALEFYKSCLFGTRSLEILELKKFPLTYNEIYEFSKGLNLDKYTDLVSSAYNVRLGKSSYEEEYLFLNISYLNKFIESKLMQFFKKHGNQVLIN